MAESEPKRDTSMCQHGNFSNSCSKCNAVTVLDVEREDLSGSVQQLRGKRNVRYVKDGHAMIAKYIEKQPVDSPNIARVTRERRLLDTLADTGLVPRVIDFKAYGRDRARLLLEEIPGTSIDRIPWKERSAFVQRHAEDIVHVTARALQGIHDRGVFISDVNEGTFLFEEQNGKLSVRLVDFELGYDNNSSDETELQDVFDFFKKNDFGFALATREGKDIEQDTSTLAKCEMHRWAKMMERIFIQRYPKVEIPPERIDEFAEYRARIQPIVEQTLHETATKLWASMQNKQRESDQRFLRMGEEAFVAWSVRTALDRSVLQQCGKFTFPQLCAANGATLFEHSMAFIARCLDANIDARPSSFDEFLVGEEQDFS